MKKVICIGIIFLVAIRMTNAQKLIVDKKRQQVFIECTADMPAGTYAPFANVAARWKNPTIYGSATVGLASPQANQVVSQKFQIANQGVAKDGTPQTAIATMSWNEAMGIAASYNTATAVGVLAPTTTTGCAGYWEGEEDNPETGRGKWRLPTQRELQLIWLFLDKLNPTNTFSGFTIFSKLSYRNSLEEDSNTAWYLTLSPLSIGSSSYYSTKSSANYVRCVRDVTP